jgi:ATP-dependent RNA helicase DDX5/DBP2
MSGEREHKEKKEKKEKREKRDPDSFVDDNTNYDTTDKKRKNRDDEEQPEKRRKTDGKEEEFVRVRTRSMSDAEEHFKLLPCHDGAEFRKLHQITITGRDVSGNETYVCPEPMTTFDSTPFPQAIRKALDGAGYANPTPTQAQSWPITLQGRDIITVAKTGSGKTCGFLLPAFHRLLADSARRNRGQPAIVVLAPTRELACQIEEESVKFGRTSYIRTVCVYGGAPKSLQVRKLQGGVEVLIATPGRLNDLLEMRVIDLTQVLFLVLDEADRMYDFLCSYSHFLPTPAVTNFSLFPFCFQVGYGF